MRFFELHEQARARDVVIRDETVDEVDRGEGNPLALEGCSHTQSGLRLGGIEEIRFDPRPLIDEDPEIAWNRMLFEGSDEFPHRKPHPHLAFFDAFQELFHQNGPRVVAGLGIHPPQELLLGCGFLPAFDPDALGQIHRLAHPVFEARGERIRVKRVFA
ncbi:MAG: hypothetical protein EBX52_03570 [Proteobacteria bacterium]|nr:hypothetical protein [Pseudomonadota bacterium]